MAKDGQDQPRKVIAAISGPSVHEDTWAEALGLNNHREARAVRSNGLGYAATVHTPESPTGREESPRIRRPKTQGHLGLTHAIGGDRTIHEAAEDLVDAIGQTVAIESRGGRNIARRLRPDEPDPAA